MSPASLPARLSRAILVISSPRHARPAWADRRIIKEKMICSSNQAGADWALLCSVIIHSVLSYREAIRNYNNYADNNGPADQLLLADLSKT